VHALAAFVAALASADADGGVQWVQVLELRVFGLRVFGLRVFGLRVTGLSKI
jgi:hypothetical protein